MLDTSVQVNTYEGGVVSIDIPVIQPDTSISVTTLVLIGIGGLFVVTSLLFVTMILINKKKPEVFELDPDEQHKCVLELAKVQAVHPATRPANASSDSPWSESSERSDAGFA